MMKWLGCLGVLVVVALVVGMMVMGTYNNLVGLGQAVDAQWAQVENQYQRRADLIPNLVSTVQGAANFEKATLEEVVKARASVGQVNLGNIPPDEVIPLETLRLGLRGDTLKEILLEAPETPV